MKVLWIPEVLGSRSTLVLLIVPSISVSFAVTFTVRGVSSFVVAVSLLATGASFIGLTVTDSEAGFEVTPLLSFTV